MKLYPTEEEQWRRDAALRRKRMRTVQDVDAILTAANLPAQLRRRKQSGLGIHTIRPATKPGRDW